MILEKSVQAQFLIPMAVSLAFGIIFATVIILIGVPVGAVMLEKSQDFLRGLAQTKQVGEFAPETAG